MSPYKVHSDISFPITLQESVQFLPPERPWDVRGLGIRHRQDLNCCGMGSPCSKETQAPPELPSASGIWVVLAPQYLALTVTVQLHSQLQPFSHRDNLGTIAQWVFLGILRRAMLQGCWAAPIYRVFFPSQLILLGG